MVVCCRAFCRISYRCRRWCIFPVCWLGLSLECCESWPPRQIIVRTLLIIIDFQHATLMGHSLIIIIIPYFLIAWWGEIHPLSSREVWTNRTAVGQEMASVSAKLRTWRKAMIFKASPQHGKWTRQTWDRNGPKMRWIELLQGVNKELSEDLIRDNPTEICLHLINSGMIIHWKAILPSHVKKPTTITVATAVCSLQSAVYRTGPQNISANPPKKDSEFNAQIVPTRLSDRWDKRARLLSGPSTNPRSKTVTQGSGDRIVLVWRMRGWFDLHVIILSPCSTPREGTFGEFCSYFGQRWKPPESE